jgi:hypothetical protein
LKERRHARLREKGLEFEPASPRTSNIGREDANLDKQLTELGVEDFNIDLTGSITINRKGETNRIFET